MSTLVVSLRSLATALALGPCGCVGAPGCVGTGEGVPNPEPGAAAAPKSYPEIQALIFDARCSAQCHLGGAAPKGLSLEPGRSWPGLVGVPAAEAPALLRVAPGNADDSYLVVKIAPSDPRRVGARMPRNGPPYLTSAEIRALKRWIAAGATLDWIDEGEAPVVDAGPPVDAGDGAGGAGGRP